MCKLVSQHSNGSWVTSDSCEAFVPADKFAWPHRDPQLYALARMSTCLQRAASCVVPGRSMIDQDIMHFSALQPWLNRACRNQGHRVHWGPEDERACFQMFSNALEKVRHAFCNTLTSRGEGLISQIFALAVELCLWQL